MNLTFVALVALSLRGCGPFSVEPNEGGTICRMAGELRSTWKSSEIFKPLWASKRARVRKNGSIWWREKWPSSNSELHIAQSANSLSTFTAYYLSLLSPVLSIHPLSIHVLIYLPHVCIYMYLLNILSINSCIYLSTYKIYPAILFICLSTQHLLWKNT